MSGEKIGSLTNNSHRGWGSRMQRGKVLNQASSPPSLLGRLGMGVACPFTEKGGCGGDKQVSRAGCAGRAARTGWPQQPGSNVTSSSPPHPMRRLCEVRTGAMLGIE